MSHVLSSPSDTRHISHAQPLARLRTLICSARRPPSEPSAKPGRNYVSGGCRGYNRWFVSTEFPSMIHAELSREIQTYDLLFIHTSYCSVCVCGPSSFHLHEEQLCFLCFFPPSFISKEKKQTIARARSDDDNNNNKKRKKNRFNKETEHRKKERWREKKRIE